MLLELKVHQFATIDKLEVHFLRPGLNILTGETGAGKSVLLKAFSLLLGGKVTADLIRTGADSAQVEGAFDISNRPDVKKVLAELDLFDQAQEASDILVIRRIVTHNGKNRIYVNGHLSTLTILERTVPLLVEITGQHEHHSLKRPFEQLEVLDRFGQITNLRKSYSAEREKLLKLQGELQLLQQSFLNREQRIDYLQFQLNEINALDPKEGEDLTLQNQFEKIKNSVRFISFLKSIEALLTEDGARGSFINSVQTLLKEGEILVKLDENLRPLLQELTLLKSNAEELSYSASKYGSKWNSLPTEDHISHDELENRLSQIKKLQRKYGGSIQEVLEFKNKAQDELKQLEQAEEVQESLKNEIVKLEKKLWTQALDLSAARKKWALKLTQGVNAELKALNMKGAEVKIEITSCDQLQATGCDEVAFMIRGAAQEPFRPLNRAASGGELSRIMLALKQVVAMSDLPMTYLFDEVDTGVSGPTAEKVGLKLKTIGKAHQVVSITHLPQVATFADAHFLITKEVKAGLVKSEIKELSDESRVQELARLISGEKITGTSRAHAKQMLRDAQKLLLSALIFCFGALVSLDSNAQPKEQKRMINQEDPLQVKSIKLSKPGPKKYHGIKLVFPPHRCTTTTGVLTFEWTYKNKTAKSAVVEIENLATGKKISLKSRSQKRRFYVQEGQYRWRVIDSSTTLDSQWRTFKTVELNAGRDVSSVTAKESAIELAQNPDLDDFQGDLAILDSLPQAKIIQR